MSYRDEVKTELYAFANEYGFLSERKLDKWLDELEFHEPATVKKAVDHLRRTRVAEDFKPTFANLWQTISPLEHRKAAEFRKQMGKSNEAEEPKLVSAVCLETGLDFSVAPDRCQFGILVAKNGNGKPGYLSMLWRQFRADHGRSPSLQEALEQMRSKLKLFNGKDPDLEAALKQMEIAS